MTLHTSYTIADELHKALAQKTPLLPGAENCAIRRPGRMGFRGKNGPSAVKPLARFREIASIFAAKNAPVGGHENASYVERIKSNRSCRFPRKHTPSCS